MARKATGKLRALTVLAGVSCLVPMTAVPRVAHADAEETREEAKRLFSQGSAAFLAKKYAEALEDLRASNNSFRARTPGFSWRAVCGS